MSRKSGVLTYPEHLGPPWPVVGELYLFYMTDKRHNAWNKTNGVNRVAFVVDLLLMFMIMMVVVIIRMMTR